MPGIARVTAAWQAAARELRMAARALRRAPGFALTSVAMLAVGIGAATAIFSVADGVLLQPLPVREPERVVVAWMRDPQRANFTHIPWGEEELRQIGRESRTLEAVAGADYAGVWPKTFRDGEETVLIRGGWVTGDFFSVMGVDPALGRLLETRDDVRGAEPVIVLSHAYWRRTGADPAVVGRRLRLQDQTYTVVGVAAEGFEYPHGAEFWGAFAPATVGLPPGAGPYMDLVGRLREGATVQRARSELTAHLRAMDATRPPMLQGLVPVVDTLPGLLLSEVRPVVVLLSAAVALLLLIACVNVANLLLVRAAGRAHELAVRAALGAGRGRIAAQLLAESSLLALAGGAFGVALAAGAVRALDGLVPPEVPRMEGVAVDGRALAFAAGVSALTVLLFGVAPALWAARPDLAGRLRSGRVAGPGEGAARGVRQALVAGQVALALLVLVGAGLLGRSLLRLQGEELGFREERLLVAQLNPPVAEWSTQAGRLLLWDELLEQVRAVPGVVAAAPVTASPFAGTGGWDAMYTAEGQGAAEQASNPWLNMELASEDYFATLGVPILRGRAIAASDRAGAPPVAVISESAARISWPGQDPLGRRIKLGGPDSPGEWVTVVGVVDDLRYRELATGRPSVYFAMRQFPNGVPGWLAVRTRGRPEALVPALRTAFAAVHPDLLLGRAAPMAEFLAAPLARPRFGAVLLGVFALVATALAALGAYGVLAAAVRHRAREIGVRMALGADAGGVRRMVLRQGLFLVAAGAVVGVAAALAGTRLLRSLLYEVAPTDPVTYVAVLALLFAVAAAACDVPARRATRIDPARVLRGE